MALVADPQVTSFEITNQKPVIHFPTFFGQQYAVEYATNLTSGNWSNLTTIAGTGDELTVIDTNTIKAARFYRLRQN